MPGGQDALSKGPGNQGDGASFGDAEVLERGIGAPGGPAPVDRVPQRQEVEAADPPDGAAVGQDACRASAYPRADGHRDVPDHGRERQGRAPAAPPRSTPAACTATGRITWNHPSGTG